MMTYWVAAQLKNLSRPDVAVASSTSSSKESILRLRTVEWGQLSWQKAKKSHPPKKRNKYQHFSMATNLKFAFFGWLSKDTESYVKSVGPIFAWLTEQ